MQCRLLMCRQEVQLLSPALTPPSTGMTAHREREVACNSKRYWVLFLMVCSSGQELVFENSVAKEAC